MISDSPCHRRRRRLAAIHTVGILALGLLPLQFQVAQAGVLASRSAGLQSIVSSAGPAMDSLALWEGMPRGPFATGFRSFVVERTTPDGAKRQIRVSLWYPAREAAAGPRLRLGDLFRIVLDEGQLPDAAAESMEGGLAVAMTGDRGGLAPERARQALATPLLARPDAPASPGRFPIALWTSRHATVLAQVPLSEILASHGVIVATAWSSDPPLAFLWEDRSEADKLATMESHTADLQHALRTVGDLMPADTTRILLLAWSYGGQTAARLQERLSTTRAIVSLDANVVPARAEERLDLRHPLVFLYGQDSTRRGVELLDRLGATVFGARLPGLAHGNFNALEGYLPAVLGADTVFRWSKGGAIARDGYRAVVRMVVRSAGLFLFGPPPTEAMVLEELGRAAAPVPVAVRRPGSAPP